MVEFGFLKGKKGKKKIKDNIITIELPQGAVKTIGEARLGSFQTISPSNADDAQAMVDVLKKIDPLYIKDVKTGSNVIGKYEPVGFVYNYVGTVKQNDEDKD